VGVWTNENLGRGRVQVEEYTWYTFSYVPCLPALRCRNCAFVSQVVRLEVKREPVESIFEKHTPEVYEIAYFWQGYHDARGQNTQGQRPDEVVQAKCFQGTFQLALDGPFFFFFFCNPILRAKIRPSLCYTIRRMCCKLSN